MWIPAVVQKVQETRLNQLADRTQTRPEAAEHSGPTELEGTGETEQHALDDETRQARVKAAWRYAMRNVVEQDYSQRGLQHTSAGASSRQQRVLYTIDIYG